MCKATIHGFASKLLNPTAIVVFENLIYFLVSFFTTNRQADAISDAYVRVMMENLKVKTFEPEYFCEVLIPACNNKRNKYKVLEVSDFEERILSDKPEIIQDNNYINNLYDQIAIDNQRGKDRDTILMYQISDLHWNLEYTEGTNSN